jgi:hypothetical protein
VFSPGVNEGVNIPPRGQISPLEAKFTIRGEVKNGPQITPLLKTILCCPQISDDEDDTHPNIDTPSLFKWRHEARVQRMEEFEKEKKAAKEEKER